MIYIFYILLSVFALVMFMMIALDYLDRGSWW